MRLRHTDNHREDKTGKEGKIDETIYSRQTDNYSERFVDICGTKVK